MGKMTLSLHNALKSTLTMMQVSCNNELLILGEDNLNQKSFCQPIKIDKATDRLLSCTRLEIRALGYFGKQETKMVEWLKQHIRFPTTNVWVNIASAHNWLKYNVANNLSCLHLGIGKIDYYIILREEHLVHFRQIAFNKQYRIGKEISPTHHG